MFAKVAYLAPLRFFGEDLRVSFVFNFSPCSMECEKFDLVFVTERFKSALKSGDDDDVVLDLYLEAFREILK